MRRVLKYLSVTLLVLACLSVVVFVLWSYVASRPRRFLYTGYYMRVTHICIDLIAYYQKTGHEPESLEKLQEFLPPGARVPLVCPVSHATAPGRSDGYEYVGMGLSFYGKAYPVIVPVVFDRMSNHPDHTRTVAFAGWKDKRTDLEMVVSESHFRRLLLAAIRSHVYPKSTVEKLIKQEPWLVRELRVHSG